MEYSKRQERIQVLDGILPERDGNQARMLQDARILIVDDQEANVGLLETLLERAGYTNVESTTDPRQVLPICVGFRPDLILLDLLMPHMDGFEIMEKLAPVIAREAYLPILVLTVDITPESKHKALSMGARDFLTKPFDHTEVILRVENLLQTRSLHLRLHDQNHTLEERVRERTRDLEQAQVEIIERLAHAAEFRDDATGAHTWRVGRISSILARNLELPEAQADLIRRAAPLHDVGKIAIPDVILLKPGRLNAREFQQMKSHTNVGAMLLSGSSFRLLQLAEEIALTHHERWDGTGYPRALTGEEIPMSGRIVTVADVFDALTHERPYKKAWPQEEALAELERQKGRQFDPRVVEAFLMVHERENLAPRRDGV